MTVAIGVILVLIAIAFVLLPLFRGSRATSPNTPDPALLRAGLYRQILDAELDTRLGKLEADEYQELRARLLQNAAALIVADDLSPAAESDAQAHVEREIAAARAAMRSSPSMRGINA